MEKVNIQIMEVNQDEKGSGNEIQQQLQQNADCYITMKENNDLMPQQMNNNKVFQTQGTLLSSIQPKQIKFEQIKLVSSVLETGDGHIQSVKIICRKCQRKVNTKVKRKLGEGACQVSCLLLLCSFGVLCIACFPFFMEDCKDIIHVCPECEYINGITPYKLFD